MRKDVAKLELYFSGSKTPQLVKSIFSQHRQHKEITAVRTYGMLPEGFSAFKWTPCTMALALFFLRATYMVQDDTPSPILLEGYRRTHAACLATKLWKWDQAWVNDMFGSDKAGNPYLRQIITGINIRQWTKGPIQLFLRTSILPVENIRVFIEDREVTNQKHTLKKIASLIESAWKPGNNGRNFISSKSMAHTGTSSLSDL